MKRMHRTTRTLLAGVLVVLLLGGGVAGASGWFDEAHFSAGVSSGTWTATPTPEPSSGDGDQGGGTPESSPEPSTPGGADSAGTAATRVIVPGDEQTVITSLTWTDALGNAPVSGNSTDVGGTWSTRLCAVVSVTSTATVWTPWSLHVNLSGQPFDGAISSGFTKGGGATNVVVTPGNSRYDLITGSSNGASPDVQWNSDWNNRYLMQGRTVTFTLCTNAPIPSPADPGYYTVVPGPVTVQDSDYCLPLTVTGKQDISENPFFFGWETDVDLTGLLTDVSQAGRAVNYISWTPTSGVTVQQDSDVSTLYHVRSGALTSIRGGGSVTVTACAHTQVQ